MALVLVTPPEVEPVSLLEAKAHLRVDTDVDDVLIAALVTAARSHAEEFTRRAFITQTWSLVLDRFPAAREIKIPLPPLQSVESITTRDEAGQESALPEADYFVDTAPQPGRVVLAPGASWPGGALYPVSAVSVQFVAGYGDAEEDVPESIRQAIKMLVAHWYENRETVLVGGISKELEFAVSALLWPHRVVTF